MPRVESNSTKTDNQKKIKLSNSQLNLFRGVIPPNDFHKQYIKDYAKVYPVQTFLSKPYTAQRWQLFLLVPIGILAVHLISKYFL